jgi:hypothetical protein
VDYEYSRGFGFVRGLVFVGGKGLRPDVAKVSARPRRLRRGSLPLQGRSGGNQMINSSIRARL